MKKPVVLVILDGFGLNEATFGNAIKAANTPFLDDIFANQPLCQLGASGMDVGLPDGQMGNSEVGHTNIGAGRIVYQDLSRITKAIEEGIFFENEVLASHMDEVVKKDRALHLFGLLSDGGVHSHIEHMYALVEMAKKRGVKKLYIHAFMDGRDVDPKSGVDFIRASEAKLNAIGLGKIASVSGRYYAMDRDKRWDRVEKAYNAIVYGEAPVIAKAETGVLESYSVDKTDEFIEPFITEDYVKMESGDEVIFYNFRPDRARELTRALCDDKFDGFALREERPIVGYVCLTEYDATMPNVEVAFKPQSLNNSLGEYISKLGLNQLRIAETEKYAHVTFFFNGGVEEPYFGEDRVLVASPKVATYDMQPEMSAYEVTEKMLERIQSGLYDMMILNYANCDMVGHTGVMDAAIKAVEVVDECSKKLVEAVLEQGGVIMITADHGNADKMMNPDGSPFTAHTTNPVPFVLMGMEDISLREGGVLADIAPTILHVMGLDKPAEMTGLSLIRQI